MSFISNLHIVGERRLARRGLLERFRSIATSHGARSLVTFIAERSRRDFCNRSHVRTYAQSRADIECLPRGHSSYGETRIAFCDSAARRCAPDEVETLPGRLRRLSPNRTGEHRWTTDAQTGALIRDLARMLPDELIAGLLNRLSKKTGKSNSWTKTKRSNSANVRLSPSISDSIHFHRPFKRLRHVRISTRHLHRPFPSIIVRSESPKE